MSTESEYLESVWIEQNLPLPAHGVYVDVGAAWPDQRSNTAFLRARGWTGLAIDGNPYYSQFWTNPPLIVAVVSNQREAPFECHYAPDLSGIREGGTMVPCRMLEDILQEHNIDKIDLLSLDCEGHEFDGLLTMNIAKHDPTIIISEYSTAGVGIDFRVRDYLDTLGYREVHRTVANIVYTK